MRRVAAAVVTLALAVVVVTGMFGGEASADERAHAIGARVKCPVCQGVAIAESPSETARAMMVVVEERIADGWTDDQIIDFFRDRYGAGIVIDPPFAGRTLLVWLLPAGALGVGLWMIATRRRASPRPEPATTEPELAP